MAYNAGYTVENRTVIVRDTSLLRDATQTIVLFLSEILVRILFPILLNKQTLNYPIIEIKNYEDMNWLKIGCFISTFKNLNS